MLYRYTEDEDFFDLDKVESFSIRGKEKTLENVLAEIFVRNGTYMPIFQERNFRREPDLVALDEHGNLILFELKRDYFDKKSALDGQLFCYHSVWKNFSYDDLNKYYKKYKDNSAELLDDHKKFFGVNLSKSDFNRVQKLIGVANEVGDDMLDYIESLNKRGDYTVDFIPYRFYKIGGELFIEFSGKPFDEDFVARRRHNLIFNISVAIDSKLDEVFLALHELEGKYFTAKDLNFRKWNGQAHFVMNFRSRRFGLGAQSPDERMFFAIGVDDKNFFIKFSVRNQDVVVPCNEVAKYISALNDAKFQHVTDSSGNESFRYDLPISSKYPTVDFVAMDGAARSLFDEKNFDAAINYMMPSIEILFNLLDGSLSALPPPTPTVTSPVKSNGSCGMNLTWQLDSGTLTISGTGDMQDYSRDDEVPWYNQRDSIKSIIIEDGIKAIGERAFQDCKSLTSVQLPCSLNKIGADAFSSCARLEEITIPSGVTFIGNNAFNSCGSLKTISIPASVETIEYFAFAFCGKLESVEILGSLDEIAGGTFQSCYRLREVKIHGTVTTISDGDGGHGAFQMCKKLESVEQILKDTIKKIGKYSFRWCENLQSVTIPSSVTDIGIQIFNGCTNLKEIRYKRGLRSADKLNDGNSARLVPY